MDSCEDCDEIIENKARLTDIHDGDRLYSIGLQNPQKIIIKQDNTILAELFDDVGPLVIQYDNGNKDMIVRNGETEEILDIVALSVDILDLDNEGRRWEGNVIEDKLYGFGSYFDGSGNFTYSGFVYEGKKCGYGVDFYQESSIVEYEGTFLNDLRHGWGSLFDRKGNKVYEGKWAMGQNSSFSLTIPNDCENSTLIHNCLEELSIGSNCFNLLERVQFLHYDNLRHLRIGDNCFKNAVEFTIDNCNSLCTVEIGVTCFDTHALNTHEKTFKICNCNQLKSVCIGCGSFHHYGRLFVLKGSVFHLV